jgi:hypothetical protein
MDDRHVGVVDSWLIDDTCDVGVSREPESESDEYEERDRPGEEEDY